MATREIIDFDVIDEYGPQEFRGAWQVSASEIDRFEVQDLGQVSIEMTVSKSEGPEHEYEAEGTVGFTADLSCSRCVDPYPFATNSPFHVTFRPRPAASEENEEVEITASEELDVEFYTDRQIPLKDLALEQVQLSIPMKPLCEENCLGLCPTCGANRNGESCKCEEKVSDERWGALRNIREELAKKKNI